MNDIQRVLVVGGGTMGRGIVQIFLASGYEVVLQEIDPGTISSARNGIREGLEKWAEKGKLGGSSPDQILDRLETLEELEKVPTVDLAVEAVVERGEVKKDVFRTLSDRQPDDTLLASNTSSISITDLASVTDRPERFIGMHFFNPVPVMKLVEVVLGVETTEETAKIVEEVAGDLGKTPVRVNDYPGFVSNRILAPMLNEAFYALMEGVAGIDEIDEIMKLGMGHPMGPLELADMIGLDVCLEILEVLHRDLGDDKYRPCPLLRKKVEAGHLGKKAGRGFYEYDR